MYLSMLAVAVLLEASVLQIIFRKPVWLTGVYALLINGTTHPLAWWFVRYQHANLLVVEFLVVAVEAAMILIAFRVIFRRALIASFAANALSAGAGLLISLVL